MSFGRYLFKRGSATWADWFGASRDLPSINVERVLELARVLHEKNRTPYLLETNAVLKTSGTRA